MCSVLFAMLYGGSRSGKTFIILRSIIIRACMVKSRHLVVRFRFNHVKQSIVMDTLQKVMAICFPNLRWHLDKSDWLVRLPNGSEIWFGGLDDKERVDKILGKEYSTIFLNETTQISWPSVITVMTRLAENVGLAPRIWFDCNPTSTKHWTYTIFKGHKDPNTEQPVQNPEQYGFLQMNPGDNLINLPDHYLNLLQGLPERARIRFLEGEFQDDIEGALWNQLMIEQAKCLSYGSFKKTVVAIDPAVTHKESSDETGIVVGSLDEFDKVVVQDDLSIKASTQTWAQRAVNAYHQYEAAYILAEVNNGGDLVENVIHSIDPKIKVKKVRASKGKFARAEPVAALYEQNEIAHAKTMTGLETQMCEWVPMNSKESPDRIDALVWLVFDLLLVKQRDIKVRHL